MEFSISKEAFVFLCAALTGAGIVFVYDLFRLMRCRSVGSAVLLHFQDGIFWLIALCMMFTVVFYVNNGTVRFYELLGAGLGALVYSFTLSAWILKIFMILIDGFLKIFSFFLKILLTPLVFMYNIMYRCVGFVLGPVTRLLRRSRKRLWFSVKQTAKLVKKK